MAGRIAILKKTMEMKSKRPKTGTQYPTFAACRRCGAPGGMMKTKEITQKKPKTAKGKAGNMSAGYTRRRKVSTFERHDK